tara:strand:+ start:934 stop:1257 length:324 start_codon:yes stop_codon:yes gene_type:complete
MSEATVVDARLDKLEQDNRRLKLALGSLLLALATVPLIGAFMPEQIPEIIQARRFEVIDENDIKRVQLDAVGVFYIDANGNGRAQLNAEGIFYSGENDNVVWRTPEQ